MKFSIRFKLLAIGIVSIISSALSVFIVSLQEHQLIYAESVKVNLAALTANTADDLLLLSGDNDPFMVRSALLRFERYEHIRYAIAYDPYWKQNAVYINQALFSQISQNKLAIPEINPQQLPLDVTIQGNNFFALHTIGEGDHIEGYLLVSHEYSQPVEKSREELLQLSAPLLTTILVIAIAAMLFTIRQQLVPLIRLSIFARNITKEKDYGARFPISGKDEVYTLAQDINSMLSVIDNEIKENAEKAKQLTEQRESMYRLANYDQLTNLPNRRHVLNWLKELLQAAYKNQETVAVLYFDLDRFKSVNDRMGHDIGDKLLIEVGQIVSSFLKKDEVVARLAGDEFVVVLPSIENRMEAVELGNKMIEAFVNPIFIDTWSIQTGLSIGIADSHDANYDVEQIITYADLAMYYSKHHAKGTLTLFHSEMLLESQRKTLIVNSIYNATKHHEFQLYYQPKVSMIGQVSGAEALIRWEHPELGSLSPTEFIPIAETSGKISEITRWVIEQVVNDLPTLKCLNPDIVISFNISSYDLKSDWLEAYIVELIKRHPEYMPHFQFEVTESNYLNDYKTANRFFTMVKEAGCSVALDDFGTGFSSLSYLGRIDIDTIKIDREFVVNFLNDKRDRAVLKAVLDLCQRLGLNSCCEGVENMEQAKYLIENGCHLMQGFYFASATPLDQLDFALERAKQHYEEIELF